MARFTDRIFRDLCKKHGADILVTEQIMSDAIIADDKISWAKASFSNSQRPIGVQIMGSDPVNMGKAAKLVENRLNPDFIDINMGCPVDKITDKNAGCALLKNLPLLSKVASTMVSSTDNTPITAKIRIGWDDNSIVALEACKVLEEAGITRVSIHGRTRQAGYSGVANWEIIEAAAESVAIPIIGNGDINKDRTLEALRTTKCKGIMIGRNALGYPWIFNEIKEYFATGEIPQPVSDKERWQTLLEYCRALIEFNPQIKDPNNIGWLRPKIITFTRGMKYSKQIRPHLHKVNNIKDLELLIKQGFTG